MTSAGTNILGSKNKIRKPVTQNSKQN